MSQHTPNNTGELIERLPVVEGRYTPHYDLGKTTWFRVGGPAEVLYRPANSDDLVYFLTHRPSTVGVTVIGGGSNLLVRDGGIRGVVIRLGGPFGEITAHGDTLVVGAGALDIAVSEAAHAHSLGGLEFLCGIPGTIGGALRMNAGAYNGDMAHCLVSCEAVDGRGQRHIIPAAEMGFGYRQSAIPEDWIFLSATLRGTLEDRATIASRMARIRARREETQPVRTRTGGSTFANPPGHSAWELIDKAGCRGLTMGGAMVSTLHCNFLLNTGTATATQLEALGEEVRLRVMKSSGVVLEWEIRRIGAPL